MSRLKMRSEAPPFDRLELILLGFLVNWQLKGHIQGFIGPSPPANKRHAQLFSPPSNT
jgi:hypothetical protein